MVINMRKLNNKGYLLVEIIVALVLAMTIAYFLIDLTLNLKEKNDDVFVDTILVTDKMLMTDTIQEDIGRYRVTKLSQPSDSMLDITYQINGSDVTKRISIESIDDRYLFKYGTIDASGNYDDTVYQKEFNEALDVDRIILSNSCYNEASDTYVACSSSADNGNGIMTIKISAYTLYSDKDYGINISVPYKTSDIVVEEYTGPREIVDEIKELGIKECLPITDPAKTDEGVCTAPDDYGTSYVFRGNISYNYVKYAGYYWRIIRINGNDTIRMIYDGTVAHTNSDSDEDRQLETRTNYASNQNDNMYVGYMYGTRDATSYEETHANENDSRIKTVVDKWYKENIVDKGYEDKIADVIYCNDRSLVTGEGFGDNYTEYGFRGRGGAYTLKCSQKNDAFTVNDTSKGNGDLTYPVGLITADELIFGGTFYPDGSYNHSTYLYNGQHYWTMTPYGFGISRNYARVSFLFSDGNVNNGYANDSNLRIGVRPVISLKGDTIFRGKGTMTEPYEVVDE